MGPQVTANDDSESAALVAPLRPALVRYFLRKCGDSAEAEDLAQDVVERALAKGACTSVEQARGYIFRIAINRWHDRNRRKVAHGVNLEWDDTASFAQGEETSPERVLSNEQELHAVVAALQELNERTRDVFVLDRLERLKHVEIARLFGISVSAVEKHVAKALAHLARRAVRWS
jgi:RNA polymerase sigma factor (sigma-70 family)